MDVIAVVKREDQIETAQLFGARQVVHLGKVEDAVAATRACTLGGRGADVVIEAVATPATWEWAVEMVRKGGTVNFFGGPPSGTRVELDTNRLHYGDITLKASFHHTPRTCRMAFDLIQSGRFKCAEYITGRAALEEVPRIFERMLTRRGDVREIKTAIFPGGVPR